MDTGRTTRQHTLRDRARRDAADRGVRAKHELTSVPDPNRDTKTFVPIKDKQSSTPQG